MGASTQADFFPLFYIVRCSIVDLQMAASNLYTKDKTTKNKTNSVTFACVKPKFNFMFCEYVFLKYILVGILFLKSIVCCSIV